MALYAAYRMTQRATPPAQETEAYLGVLPTASAVAVEAAGHLVRRNRPRTTRTDKRHPERPPATGHGVAIGDWSAQGPRTAGLIEISARHALACDKDHGKAPDPPEVSSLPTTSGSPSSKTVPVSALVLFLAVTFLITWGVIGTYIIAPDMAVGTFGEISGAHPLFFLATWSPAIAAFVVVALHGGVQGLRAFLARLLMWCVSWGWTAFILFVIPLVFVAGSLIKGGPVLAPLPPEGAGAVVAVMFMMLLSGAYRGIRLARRHATPAATPHGPPIWAGPDHRRHHGGSGICRPSS